MKKSTKGALAAGAAAALLLGGAGTLAFWTADGVADGGSITAGTLTLTDGTCDPEFVYADGAASEGDDVVLFVPGDIVTKDCTFEIGATGDNLEALLAAPDTVTFETDSGEVLTATVDTTYTIGGDPAADGDTITSADDGAEVVVTFLVDIDYGTADDPFGSAAPTTPGVNGNLTQGITAALDDLTVTLTQVDPN
ncbi:hypothetical protein HMPREF0063_10574 [Aeromicrobium marinum DSM 15272]|uniref:Alternate signal-mediated exported protein, RER_14450 family n=1 Tax=Aeromicrobium marinum DSM 15272 TaxID=585531 RepID=E2S9D4_9ACTN|nr:alternate-type signal peptide domain-containing protein [Aeromicrobium marinum]EFQ83858.1 hypothetical protein HMPREF0063_10574 [Aeromicrobium marinum DSM 15272]